MFQLRSGRRQEREEFRKRIPLGPLDRLCAALEIRSAPGDIGLLERCGAGYVSVSEYWRCVLDSGTEGWFDPRAANDVAVGVTYEACTVRFGSMTSRRLTSMRVYSGSPN